MNRREFATAAGIGVGGFLFPQKSEGVAGLVLEEMSDLEMAQLIAEFPQGPKSSFDYTYRSKDISMTAPSSHVWKLILREGPERRDSRYTWRSEGTIILAKSGNHSCSAKPDTRLLRVVEFYYATDSTNEEDIFTPDLIFRRRNGLWFGIDLR